MSNLAFLLPFFVTNEALDNLETALHIDTSEIRIRLSVQNDIVESCVDSESSIIIRTSGEQGATGATGATSYVWTLTPSTAGTITGTGITGSVNWDNTFTDTAQITVDEADTIITGK